MAYMVRLFDAPRKAQICLSRKIENARVASLNIDDREEGAEKKTWSV